MKIRSLIAFCIATMFAFLSAAFAASNPQTLPVSDILKKLNRAGFQKVNEVELEKNVYEIEGLTRKGQKFELQVDAKNGKILKKNLVQSRRKPTVRTTQMMNIAKRVERSGYQPIHEMELSGKQVKVKAPNKQGRMMQMNVKVQ